MRRKINRTTLKFSLFLFLSGVSPLMLNAQNIAPSGFVPSGGGGKSEKGSIDYTLGQLFFEPVKNDKASLTVGLQQPDWKNAQVNASALNGVVCAGATGIYRVVGPKGLTLTYKVTGDITGDGEKLLLLTGEAQFININNMRLNTVLELLLLKNTLTGNQTKIDKKIPIQVFDYKPKISVGDTSLCTSEKLTIKSLVPAPDGLLALKWKLNDQVVQQGNEWSPVFNKSGDYTLTMVSLYGGICSDSISVKVKVSETPPLAEMDATDGQVFCVFDTIRLIGQGDGYRWYRNEVLLPKDTLSYLMARADTAYYQGEVRSKGGCHLKTASVQLFIRNGILKPSLKLNLNRLTNVDTLKGYKKMTWYKDNILMKDSVGQMVTLTSFGKYQLRAQDSLGCWNESPLFDYAAKWFDSLVCSEIKVKPSSGIQGEAYKGTVEIPYLKGTGEEITFDTLRSKGITGMLLYLSDKKLKNGNGSLKFSLSGTATEAGVVTFNVEVGGKSCSVSLPIEGLSEQIATIKAFTPNGDGINDVWGIPELRDRPEVRITIFDREGIKVYEMSAIEGWDGRDNGLSLPSGDYWFVIKYPAAEGKENQIGHFTLLR